ncbi:hypothetical protein T231_14880 [Tannerella sp. oral taxon BU063 isolate Cell 6/7/9]|uniref:Uncharacterized protein n=1 Tax=Tannerella sp. oral taxon BU063 isolate Cell 6/7/9 TaxID=1411021 RepID=W2CNB5_9BACT|nr:hypothetical protein T231_14880 [Tannerella sp. oral taxon BU063 isolate Cell 6/7/9]
MQGRHCNFCNTQRINGSRTHLFAHDKAKCAIESAIASFFVPHPAPFSPVLSLSEILLNHVVPVTHAAALILASDSFGRPSAVFVLPYPAAVRPFAAFVFATDSFGRPSAAFVFATKSSGRPSAAFMMPCICSVYDLNRPSKINIVLSMI